MTQSGSAVRCPDCGGSYDAQMICKRCGAPAAGVALAADVSAAGQAGSSVNGVAASHTTGRTTASAHTTGMNTSGASSTLGSTTLRRQKLGYGLLDMPVPQVASADRFAGLRAAQRDPAVVAEKLKKRGLKCGNCNKPVSRIKGFCPSCTQPYDYTPLPTGAIIDDDPSRPGTGTRAVAGFLGAGAMGAVYCVWNFMVPPSPADLALLQAVAEDTVKGTLDGANLHGRAEVVKVVLNATNKAQIAASLAEMESVTRIEHLNMARLYQFFVAQTSDGSRVNAMAMEYVPGQMLTALREQQPGGGPVPLGQAIATLLPIADLLNYLHGSVGFTLTDIKGDNIIYSLSGAKVVDAGGLHEIGTGGTFQVAPLYAAPEIRRTGPTPQTDVFAFFQTLAELSFTGFGVDTSADDPLPEPDQEPIFGTSALGVATRKTFARGLHPDPRRRFYADEASSQLVGLLRQLTADPKAPRAFESQLFAADASGRSGSSFGKPDPAALPSLRPDSTDPGYQVISSADGLSLQEQIAFFRSAAAATPESAELPLAALNAQIAAAGDNQYALDHAERDLARIQQVREDAEREEWEALIREREAQGARIRPEDRSFEPSYEWREDWYRGRLALAQGTAELAMQAFSRVDDWLPGELAPKLALAMAAELGGERTLASLWYAHVFQTDPSYRTAAFGLVRSLVRAPKPTLSDLNQAGEVLAQLGSAGDGLAIHKLRAELFLKAASVASGTSASSGQLVGVPLVERELRWAAERELNRCCTFATTRKELAEYVRLACAARPVTLW